MKWIYSEDETVFLKPHFKAERINPSWCKVHLMCRADVDVVTSHALHGICRPSLLIHQWGPVNETMHANIQYSLSSLRPSPDCTATQTEETTLICFHRPKEGRQRRARLDRESLGRWPYTPDSDNTSDGVHSQWAGEETPSLSFSSCTSCISSEERVMSPIRFPHGSA